jgi:hypothetical protein
MSGHANFSAIEGVRPTLPAIQQPGEDIGISLNKSVGVGKGAGAADVGDGSENVPLQEVDNGAEKAGALLRQLDVLLARAAESATKGIDATSLKTTLNQVNLSKGDRKTLNTAADNADAAFKAINKFTGFELAASVSAKDGKFGWDMTNPAGEAIKKALDAQMELSDKLRQIVNQLPQGELADSLEEALMQCDRRCCEIQTLVCQFADILENNPIPTDQAVVDRLSQTLERLLPRQALQMHGNDAAIAAMKKTVEPLAKRLDDLSKTQGQGARLSNEEVAAIGREIDTMANALKDAAKRGVAGDSGIGVDRTLFTAAKDILDAVGGRLVNARREIAMESMVNFAEKTFAPIPLKILDPKFLPILKVLSPNVGQFVARRENMRKAAVEYAKDPSDENYGKLKDAADEYAKSKGAKNLLMDGLAMLAQSLSRAIVVRGGDREKSVADALTTAIKNSKTLNAGEKAAAKAIAKDFAKLYIPFAPDVLVDTEKNKYTLLVLRFAGVSNGAPSQAVHLKLMHETAEQMSNDDFLTSDTVRAAFEGKLRFTTLVEARLHGMRDEDIDPKLDDINHVSSDKRGSGALNSVYEVGYKDGTSFIFKPEAPGRQAMENLTIAKGIEATQMVAQLNIASQKTADALGLGDVMVKTTVGSHKGEFGIFMEKAKGVEAEDFPKLGNSVKPPAGDLSLRQIKNLDDVKYAKVVGGLMRQANRLEWFDMITGQGDRHSHNFFVSVGKDGTVSLKGIDNDACFPEYRTGIRTFQLTKAKADLLKAVIADTAENLYQYSYEEDDRDDLLDALMTDPGIEFHDDGTATVDTTKFESPILHYCIMNTIGMHTTALPDYIDKDLYDKLMALAEPGERREKFIADLTANLPKGAKDAAISRLDDAINYARTLFNKRHVVSAEEWVDHDKQREIAGKVPPAPTARYFANAVPCGSSTNAKVEVGMRILHLTEGYFRRNIMRAVARPGWFD